MQNTVRPIAKEPLRYLVLSRRPGIPPHLVDLEEYNFNGRCTCEHFIFTLGPKLRQGYKPAGEESMCWHIRQAWLYFRMASAMAVSRMAYGKPSDKKPVLSYPRRPAYVSTD